MSASTHAAQAASARADIQANLVRASKFADGVTRNWSLFFFFRILTDKHAKAVVSVIENGRQENKAARFAAHEVLRLALEQPALVTAGLIGQPAMALTPDEDEPHRFRHWLKVLVSADGADARKDAEAIAESLRSGETSSSLLERGAVWNGLQAMARGKVRARPERLSSALAAPAALMGDPDRYTEAMARFGANADSAGLAALRGSLVGVALYELMRQGAPAFARDGDAAVPAIRDEGREARASLEDPYDPVASNLAFTHAGLKALKLDDTTLDSFPEPFQEGMANRAARLHDTGPSAPATWHGELGLPSIHGYFTGGFLVGGPDRKVEEALWRRLRRDVAAFNDPQSKEGADLRAVLGLVFVQFGLEIVQIELGQDPYEVDEDGWAVPSPYRLEHFGFRDGISQPFVDMGLGDAAATPSRNDTWAPAAPGEIYLDQPDEDGQTARLPVNGHLRRNATYVVFRKLEQDVVGFRSYLGRQRPDDPGAQTRLAAQFVGRWPNGTPLVLSPDTPRDTGDEALLNDFRYVRDDPQGAKCPLGAHVRRANPRDIGGGNRVKRHRILRRGMAYGGPLLPPGSLGDGTPRGLLFIAANSRIDVQFEVIQSDWLNGGEFLGQAGLGRCPVSGDHGGRAEDAFLEAGATAPVRGLPRFVTTRGGDYFFAPGVETLRRIADGERFPPEDVLHDGHSMADPKTLGLFARPRLAGYVEEILQNYGDPTKPSSIRIKIPDPSAAWRKEATGAEPSIVFVGQHRDVERVLSDKLVGSGQLEFSVEAYHDTAQRITRGQDFVVSTDLAGSTAPARYRLHAILAAAWSKLMEHRRGALGKIAAARLEASLRRTRPVGRIDLVRDLAVEVAYGVLDDLYGVPGPTWLTELAGALPFGRQHLAELPRDWLQALGAGDPEDPGLLSMQIWAGIMLADTLGNLQSAQEAFPLSRQAGAEILSHVDSLLAKARARPPKIPTTLVAAFVANEALFVQVADQPASYDDADAYYRDVAVILAEIAGDTISAVPTAFGNVMDFLLDHRIPIWKLAPILDRPPPNNGLSGWRRLIYEAERLNPVLPVLQRRCETRTELPSGAVVEEGEWVAALVQAADMDPVVFRDPYAFSLDPYIPGPPRPAGDYMMFGATDSGRDCWGRHIAMALLEPCLKAAASLNDLRGVAGVGGGPRKLFGMTTIGLPARFTPARPRRP